MARGVARGDVWLYRLKSPAKRRPVVVLSRQAAIDVLHTVMVAPVTSTIRGAPGEVLLGPEHGLMHTSAASLDHVQTVEKSRLVQYVGSLGPDALREVCRRLALATGCR